MKLAFVCTEMLPSPAIKGGAIQILIDGIAPIIAERHDLSIFSITDPDLPETEGMGRIKYIRFPRKGYSESVAEYLKNNSANNESFDVIHVFNRPRVVSRYKRASPNCKFVLSLHNEMFHPQKINDEEGLRSLGSVETIMTVSNYIGDTVRNRFPDIKPRIQTVYSGVDLTVYVPIWAGGARREDLRQKIGVQDKKVVLFVGRLSTKKGPHLLIEAMKEVLLKHPDAVLVIIGGRWFADNSVNDYVSELYSLAEPLGESVIFTKFVNPSDMPDYYLIGDVFVCASQWQEPLARVHYEAMAAGLPIITTKRGGNAEVIKHSYNGIVISDYSNTEAFIKAINKVLSNPRLAFRLGKTARRVAERNYSYERVASELLKIYEKATGQPFKDRKRIRAPFKFRPRFFKRQ